MQYYKAKITDLIDQLCFELSAYDSAASQTNRRWGGGREREEGRDGGREGEREEERESTAKA